jgi:hypothetical protein
MFLEAFDKTKKKGQNVYSTGNALHVTLSPQVSTVVSTAATGAVAKTVAPAAKWQLNEIRIHLSAAGGAGNLTATMDAGAGAAYDSVIYTKDMTSVVDLVWIPDSPIVFSATDELDIAWANASNRTYGLEVVYSLV